MGCHLADGSGESGRVPSIRRSLVLFSAAPEGRQYVIRVPGVAQSPLSDEETAALLNWMARNLSDLALPPDFTDYSAAEIRRWRSQPLAEVSVVRARLMSAAPPQPDPHIAHDSILGFSAPHTAAQHRLESVFQSLPSAGRAREWHRTFTTEPHPAASAENNRLAAVIAHEWRKQGWENVRLRRYDVLHSRPRAVTLEMTAPVRFKATLREDPVDGDPDTKNPRIDAAYFGYSASGDVTAELVYAHSGNPEDYELLRQNGISVKGKVVIVRYSNPYSYRGFKALTAEREGAAALLIYSDPAGDGYARGKGLPGRAVGAREPHPARRHHLRLHRAGRPDHARLGLRSGREADPGVARRDPCRKFPALPLSWRDAKPLLEHMSGAEVPPEWRGALPITYRFTGAVRVYMSTSTWTRSIKPYTVVEARIRGSELPDEWVLVGNHRDAWVYGGVDPVSGTAAMLELTRSLARLQAPGNAAAPHDRRLQLGRRRIRAHRIDRVGRAVCRPSSKRSWSPTSTSTRRLREPPPRPARKD